MTLRLAAAPLGVLPGAAGVVVDLEAFGEPTHWSSKRYGPELPAERQRRLGGGPDWRDVPIVGALRWRA